MPRRVLLLLSGLAALVMVLGDLATGAPWAGQRVAAAATPRWRTAGTPLLSVSPAVLPPPAPSPTPTGTDPAATPVGPRAPTTPVTLATTANPATPATPATRANPATPATRATSANPATRANPATPGRADPPQAGPAPLALGPGHPPAASTPAGAHPVTAQARVHNQSPAAAGSTRCPRPAPAAVGLAPGSGRTVALTFDDGPSPYTSALLDLLHADGVHATFFMIGSQLAGQAGAVARVAAEGHLIGDHTWHHSYPSAVPGGWTAAYLRAELLTTRSALTQITGNPVCWFRPPGGDMPTTLLPTARSLGFSVALWSVDPRDWQLQSQPGRTAAAITDQIVARVSVGLSQQHPVILMHDGGGRRGDTVAAVARIIALYRAHGYRFVRLDGQA
jgi:peptidoglycan-N-acetylglucosamine deacetylase